MPSGSVIEYDGARGKVFRIKFRDAEGKQVMETVGAARDGWTKHKAEAELRERLVRVDKKNYRHPKPMSFETYAETWFAEGPARRRWKPRTIVQYRAVRRRLIDWFGSMPLVAVRPRHVAAYVAASKLGPATVGVDLSILADDEEMPRMRPVPPLRGLSPAVDDELLAFLLVP